MFAITLSPSLSSSPGWLGTGAIQAMQDSIALLSGHKEEIWQTRRSPTMNVGPLCTRALEGDFLNSGDNRSDPFLELEWLLCSSVLDSAGTKLSRDWAPFVVSLVLFVLFC